jgi:hypothetical protein
MNRVGIADITLPRNHADRGPWRPLLPDPSPAHCPGCGAAFQIDTGGLDEPDRSIGICTAPQCGEVVTFRVCEGRLIIAERRRR